MMSPFEWKVMTLWKMGWDTLDIARELSVLEYEVANILFHLRERKGDTNAERNLAGSAQ